MKTEIKNLFLLPILIAALGLMLAGRVTAQTFKVLYSFTATSGNKDGAGPGGGLVLSDGTLYGTATSGGSFGYGVVFAINTDGTGFTNLHSFTSDEGTGPSGGLILSGNTLYGTAAGGGSSFGGTVFTVNKEGTVFTNLHNFVYTDGTYPTGLILSDGILYGTLQYGGPRTNRGGVYAINTNGTDFTVLHSFTGLPEGESPDCTLVLSSNILYGTASASSGISVVFAINTDGTGLKTLHFFQYGIDGIGPSGGLILSGNTLYGTTKGAYSENGTVFAVKTDGTGFATLKNFTNENDGVSPRAGLVLSGNTLYGTTYRGGNSGNGIAFALNTDGSGFTKLHDFTATSGFPSYTNSDGANPYASLTLSGNTLYGTAYAGGSSGNGTVFSIFIHPQLTIIPSEANVILTWPTNYTDFILQSATNLVSPIWITNSQVSVIVNGQNTVTNPISGTQQFFRLSH